MAKAVKLQTTFSSLPRELLSEIIARVAASSFTDLFQTKQCCKVALEASKDDKIYQRVCLDKFGIIQWHTTKREKEFLKKCGECENPEYLYREGVIDYFRDENLESALECLEKAAKSGHNGAAYALAIIFIYGRGELKQKGITMLSAMKKSPAMRGRVKDYRSNLQMIVNMIWVRNSLLGEEKPICCAMQHMRIQRGWPTDAINEEENTCEGCTCDEEIEEIVNALPRAVQPTN